MWAVTPANVSGRRLCSSPLAQPKRNSPSNSGSKINLSRERSREMWHEKSPLSTQSPQPPHHSKARCRRTTMKRRGTVATSSVLHATGTSKRLRFEGELPKAQLSGPQRWPSCAGPAGRDNSAREGMSSGRRSPAIQQVIQASSPDLFVQAGSSAAVSAKPYPFGPVGRDSYAALNAETNIPAGQWSLDTVGRRSKQLTGKEGWCRGKG